MSIETGCEYSGTPAGCYVSKKLLKAYKARAFVETAMCYLLTPEA